MFIKIPQVMPAKSGNLKKSMSDFMNETLEGFKYIWHRKGMRDLFVMAAILNFFCSPIAVLLPFYVEDHLGMRTDWFGFLLAALGAGALLGYLLAGTLKIAGRQRSILIILFLIGLSIFLGTLGMVDIPIIALLLFLLIGFMSGTINVYIITILQVTTSSEIRGRVFGVLNTLSAGLMPLGMGLAGIVADLTDQNIPLILIACGAISVLLTIALSSSPELREFLAYEQKKENLEEV
jgi:DHA3 family macrolide efflux protein-like MFS transporter